MATKMKNLTKTVKKLTPPEMASISKTDPYS
jgi:hypothetical protein